MHKLFSALFVLITLGSVALSCWVLPGPLAAGLCAGIIVTAVVVGFVEGPNGAMMEAVGVQVLAFVVGRLLYGALYLPASSGTLNEVQFFLGLLGIVLALLVWGVICRAKKRSWINGLRG